MSKAVAQVLVHFHRSSDYFMRQFLLFHILKLGNS
jgi:hypothetical protein